MKNTLHKMNALRVLTLCLSLCLVLSVLSLPALAASETEPVETEWTISDDGQTISGDGTVLHRYTLPAGYGYEVSLSVRYQYQTTVRYQGFAYTVYTPYAVAGTPDENPILTSDVPDPAEVRLLWLERPNGQDLLFVTDDMRAELDALREGKGTACCFCFLKGYNEWYTAGLTFTAYQAMLASGKSTTIPASELSGHLDSEVLVSDSTDSVFCAVGAVFTLDSGVFLVDFSTLPANCFDAEGHISYRAGDIPGVMLDKGDADAYRSAERSYRSVYWVYCSESDDPVENETGELILFWIVFVLDGFLLPVAPLVLGLVFANKKKWGKPRRWYLLSILAAAWMLIAAIIMIILLV